MSTAIEKINVLERQLTKVNNYRQQSITKKTMYEQQLEDISSQMKSLGISNVSDIDSEIEKMDKEIEKKIAEIENVIPQDIIQRYAK